MEAYLQILHIDWKRNELIFNQQNYLSCFAPLARLCLFRSTNNPWTEANMHKRDVCSWYQECPKHCVIYAKWILNLVFWSSLQSSKYTKLLFSIIKVEFNYIYSFKAPSMTDWVPTLESNNCWSLHRNSSYIQCSRYPLIQNLISFYFVLKWLENTHICWNLLYHQALKLKPVPFSPQCTGCIPIGPYVRQTWIKVYIYCFIFWKILIL